MRLVALIAAVCAAAFARRRCGVGERGHRRRRHDAACIALPSARAGPVSGGRRPAWVQRAVQSHDLAAGCALYAIGASIWRRRALSCCSSTASARVVSGRNAVCAFPSGPRALRVADANAARHWLQSQDFVKPDRIALLGWSNGGTSTLWAVRPHAAPRDGKPDFRAAVAFYPGCRLLNEAAWSARIPTLVLIGAAR